MEAETLHKALGALLMSISQEIHPDARARIRGRATYMAACMERDGDTETASACRNLADALAIEIVDTEHAHRASPQTESKNTDTGRMN